MSWQEKALQQITTVLGPNQHSRLVRLVTDAASLGRPKSIFKRLSSAQDRQAIFDLVAEIRFGLAFKQLRFEVEFEPLGEKGPDLRVSRNGESAYVEVKRFRPSGAVVVQADEIGEVLLPYGNPAKDIKKVIDELLGKFKQVDGGNGIVALCSDNDKYEELEFESAMNSIMLDVAEGRCQRADGLLFCLFRALGRNIGRNQLVYVEAFEQLSSPFSTWVEELRKL